jgi:replicative DNA helicase
MEQTKKSPRKAQAARLPKDDRSVEVLADLKAERAVLAALLIDKRAIFEAIDMLTSPEIFFHEPNRAIWEACHGLHADGLSVDMISVSSRLAKNGTKQLVGGDGALIVLTQEIASSANISQHCLILLEKWMRRKMRAVSLEYLGQSVDEEIDTLDAYAEWSKDVQAVGEATTLSREKDIVQLLQETAKDVERISVEASFTGYDTGFAELNRKMGGWQPGELIIVGARPGMGKTAFALATLLASAGKEKPNVFISYEMKDVAIAKRMIAVQSPTLHSNQLFREGLKKPEYWQEFMQVVDDLGKKKILVMDHMPNVYKLGMELRRIKHQRGLGLVVIDYLQLIETGRQSNNRNRENDVSEVSRALKKLSIELSVPIIALSQLSREVEKRTNKRPKLSDLRESGAIEQDADMVGFLYRDAYYNPNADNTLAEFEVAKQRNGSLGTVIMGWQENKVKYYDRKEELYYGGAKAEENPF